MKIIGAIFYEKKHVLLKKAASKIPNTAFLHRWWIFTVACVAVDATTKMSLRNMLARGAPQVSGSCNCGLVITVYKRTGHWFALLNQRNKEYCDTEYK